MICTWMRSEAQNAHTLTPTFLVAVRKLERAASHPPQAIRKVGVSHIGNDRETPTHSRSSRVPKWGGWLPVLHLTDTARGGRDAASPAAFCFIDKGSCPDAEQVRELGEYYKEGPPFGKRTL